MYSMFMLETDWMAIQLILLKQIQMALFVRMMPFICLANIICLSMHYDLWKVVMYDLVTMIKGIILSKGLTDVVFLEIACLITQVHYNNVY